MPRRVRVTGVKGRRHPVFLSMMSGKAPTDFLSSDRSPKFHIGIIGHGKVINVFKKILNTTPFHIERAVEKSLFLLSFQAKKNLLVGVTRAYKTGKLFNSVSNKLEKVNADFIQGVSGTFGVDYSIYVHEGTYQMESRPFLLLAFIKHEKKIVNTIRMAIIKEM